MGILIQNFNDEKYKLITLKNKQVSVTLTNIGASIVSLIIKDKFQNDTDIVLGFENAKGYLNNEFCFGATIGRNANRIENATFKIDENIYHLDKNDGNNNLHSGFNKTSDIIWDFEINENQNFVKFSTILKDGFQNMPGNFNISVYYFLEEDNSLKILYKGICDKKTIANFTNHTYFNLDGHDSNDILNQKVMINADFFTPFKPNTSIPSGEILSVLNTPMNFKNFKKIGEEIDSNFEQIKFANGYDHNFVLNRKNDGIILAAKAFSEKTGISLEVFTDLPGLQFYTGNFNNATKYCKNDTKYLFRSGYCFETQFFPNSCNLNNFKSPFIDANQPYESTTIYKFIKNK